MGERETERGWGGGRVGEREGGERREGDRVLGERDRDRGMREGDKQTQQTDLDRQTGRYYRRLSSITCRRLLTSQLDYSITQPPSLSRSLNK